MDDSYMDETLIEAVFCMSEWDNFCMYTFKNEVAALRYITHDWTELDIFL